MRVRWWRRLCQGFCLTLFLWLFWRTRFNPQQPPGALEQLFFHLDPLILLGAGLAGHWIVAAAWLALITLAVTVVLGRVFCGWVCPLGTINAMASWLRAVPKRVLVQTETWTRWQRAKYYVLIALTFLALCGGNWIGLFDPISLLFRSLATVVYPATQYAVEEASTAVYRADPRLGPLHVTALTEPAYRLLRDHVFHGPRQAFGGSAWIALIFAAIVALNLFRKRFWCRYLCPLGGLLGLAAQRPLLRLVNDAGQCGGCNLCTAHCQGAAQPNLPGEWRPSECFACWNCIEDCRSGALKFAWASPLESPTAARLDLSRRAVLGAGLAGVGGLLLFRLSPHGQAKIYNPALIRPPGSLAERDFLARCVQCGVCMKVCPTNALQPATTEAGLEGLWSPVLVPMAGYCEHDCNLCGQVCPTGAIAPLALAAKQQIKIGLATIDTTRCLPYAYGKECSVCEEHCPTATKAIYFREEPVRLRDGGVRVLKQPRVDADLCIGCGICENKCPFNDVAAIRVTSAGETRHPGNRPFLESAGAGYG